MYELLTTPAIERAQWKSRLHGPKPAPSNLYFTEAWPDGHKWAKGKYWEIVETAPVFYEKGYVTPGDDFIDLDLSNATGGVKLFPEAEGVVYEMLVGLKPGNYQVGVYIPGPSDYLLALGDSPMYPDLADPERRYLGAITPTDSPYDNPLLKLWAIADMQPWVLKTYVLQGVTFGKPILGFRVAKHRLVQIEKPEVFTSIKYFTEIKGTW